MHTKYISHSHSQPAMESINIGSCSQFRITAVDNGDITTQTSPHIELLIDQNRCMVDCLHWLTEICDNVIHTYKVNGVVDQANKMDNFKTPTKMLD